MLALESVQEVCVAVKDEMQSLHLHSGLGLNLEVVGVPDWAEQEGKMLTESIAIAVVGKDTDDNLAGYATPMGPGQEFWPSYGDD